MKRMRAKRAGLGRKCMKGWKLAPMLFGLFVLAGCGSNGASTGITISPTASVVVLNGTQQFTGTVTGNSNTNVNWLVSFQNGTPILGGNSTLGTISTTGLYTAPSALPNPPMVTVVAQAAGNTRQTASAPVTLDSGIRVQITPGTATLGTGETFTFTATVTGTSNTAVTWEVNGIAGGNTGTGTISTTGVFTAPSTQQSVVVAAVSQADDNQSATATVTIDTAVDPILTSLDPTTTGQASVQQDVYLTGSNFFNTSAVLANGIPVTPVIYISTTFLRVTLPASSLSNVGSIAITVERQNGDQSAPQSLTVNPVRPAVVSSSPDSTLQGSSAVSIGLDGGYYSVSTLTDHTLAYFNGKQRTISATSTRQLNVGLSSGDTATPGFYSVVVQNTGVAQGSPAYSASNLAVQPLASTIPLTPIATVATGATPVSIAVNTATGVAVVASSGTVPGTLTLISLSTNAVIGTIQVGNGPTSVAVDNILNQAAVVNNIDNTLSIVDLNAETLIATVPLPPSTTAYSVGLNPLTHRGLVANQSTNAATVVDLSTSPPGVVCVVGGTNPDKSCAPGQIVPPVSTGPAPSIAVNQRLNWAVVTPGGAGAVTVVDLGTPTISGITGRTPAVMAIAQLQSTTQGISINQETGQSLLSDPINNFFTEFSLLDQTINTLTFDKGEVATAVNQLTNLGISVNSLGNVATVIDLEAFQPIVSGIQVGTTPVSVDVDPVTNEAVVANSGSNTVSVLSLGAVTGMIRPLHVIETSPATTLTSDSPLSLTVIGGGFVSGSVVRLDQTNMLSTTVMPAGCTTACRELVATVPASLLALPRRFIVDVVNPDATVTNATDLTVMTSVNVGLGPSAVAIDTDREMAVVTNATSGTISMIDLATGLASAQITVGSDPEGVAVIPRLGEAIVTNFGSNTASVVNVVQGLVSATPQTGIGPLGISIEQDTGIAVVANSGSNTVSLINANTALSAGSIPADMFPIATAVDPALNYAAVVAANQGTVMIVDLTNNFTVGRISGLNLPSGVVFDPVMNMFIVANSLVNNIVLIDPQTLQTTNVRTGINPYSLDYNFQTSTLVTANSISGTISVMDYLAQKVKAILPITNASLSSVAIDPVSNMAVVADYVNNRVLLVPLPR